MLRRRRPAKGRYRVFLAPRPVPTRLAGYNPVAPQETRRVPPSEQVIPPAPIPPPAGEEPFPPYPPVFFPDWPRLPPILVPPVLIPPVEPPCDEDNPDDEDCPEEPEEPPVDAPEPALPLLLILGGAVWWAVRRKGQPTV